jgi:hypothetical protein
MLRNPGVRDKLDCKLDSDFISTCRKSATGTSIRPIRLIRQEEKSTSLAAEYGINRVEAM